MSSDVLWSMLTPDERSKFVKVFNDPNSDLAQQLLSSERLEKEIQEPWWEAPIAGEDEGTFPQNCGQSVPRRSGARPDMMKIPASMVKPIPSGHPLVYNMCAIWSVHIVFLKKKSAIYKFQSCLRLYYSASWGISAP